MLFAGIAVVRCLSCVSASRTRLAPSRPGAIPLAPGIFAVASLAIVLNALWNDLVIPVRNGAPWGPAAAGLIIIGLGIPLYFFFSRRSSNRPAKGERASGDHDPSVGASLALRP